MQNLDVPDIRGFYQVAQLYVGRERQPWIIGHPTEVQYSEFLEQILIRRNLPIQWEVQETPGQIILPVEVPSLQGPNGEYVVKGLGKCTKVGSTYIFLDEDIWTYDKLTSEEHLGDFKRLNPDFKYEIYRQEIPKPKPIRKFRLIKGNNPNN